MGSSRDIPPGNGPACSDECPEFPFYLCELEPGHDGPHGALMRNKTPVRWPRQSILDDIDAAVDRVRNAPPLAGALPLEEEDINAQLEDDWSVSEADLNCMKRVGWKG